MDHRNGSAKGVERPGKDMEKVRKGLRKGWERPGEGVEGPGKGWERAENDKILIPKVQK